MTCLGENRNHRNSGQMTGWISVNIQIYFIQVCKYEDKFPFKQTANLNDEKKGDVQ